LDGHKQINSSNTPHLHSRHTSIASYAHTEAETPV